MTARIEDPNVTRIGNRMQLARELATLYKAHGGLDPRAVVEWARKHPGSALYERFDWNDGSAAEKYRIWQARELITEVEIVYADGKKRQVYVSPIPSRGQGGYLALVDVLKHSGRRARFLKQALDEYERVGRKYRDLTELAGVRAVVASVASRFKRRA